jgi:polysaccharide biosynthesis protein PslG
MGKAKLGLGRRARAWTAALGISLLGLAFLASSAAALPAGFWGVVPQATPNAEQFQRLKQGGVQSVRIPILWGGVQPNPGGPLDWSATDAIVKLAAAAGVRVLPFITGAPGWAVPQATVHESGNTIRSPAHLPVSGAAAGAWSNLLRQAVARYGPGGALWAENPQIPPRPIREWQIWNEQNFVYFVARPNPAEYGKLVKLSVTALKAADPGAKVVLGGMFARPKNSKRPGLISASRRNYFAADFLERMYRQTPGIAAKFAGVALHPYTYFFQQLPGEIEELRSVMAKSHDAGKGLLITELGWSSERPERADLFKKGVAGQAKQLRGSFSLFKSKQAKWHLKNVYWFSVDDQAGSCNFCGGSGLFGPGFAPKRSWFEYVRFAGGTP